MSRSLQAITITTSQISVSRSLQATTITTTLTSVAMYHMPYEQIYFNTFYCLKHVFGIQGSALSWFKSYLTDRQQVVSVNGKQSKSFHLLYGVPQGSVLGPILFIMYTQSLTHVINSHSLHHKLYADDTQLYKS